MMYMYVTTRSLPTTLCQTISTTKGPPNNWKLNVENKLWIFYFYIQLIYILSSRMYWLYNNFTIMFVWLCVYAITDNFTWDKVSIFNWCNCVILKKVYCPYCPRKTQLKIITNFTRLELGYVKFKYFCSMINYKLLNDYNEIGNIIII